MKVKDHDITDDPGVMTYDPAPVIKATYSD